MSVTEEIPKELEPAASAAVAWLNDTRGTAFRLTGVVDTDAALATPPDEPREFGVILCEGEQCLREQVRVTPNGSEFAVEAIRADRADAIPALLDPPVGVRRTWIDDQLKRYDFILLLFYRGRW